MSGKPRFDLATRKLSKELHKQIVRKFEERKVSSSFKENIWRADITDMKLLSKFSKRVLCFVICY